MSQKFLQGHRLKISPKGSWRVTRISRRETFNIKKVVFWPCILLVERFLALSSVFQIRWPETKLLWFEDFGRQPNWKLKGHNRSNQKYRNGFFLMSSLCLIEFIGTDEIGFGWVELILLTFEDLPPASDQGRWRVTRR